MTEEQQLFEASCHLCSEQEVIRASEIDDLSYYFLEIFLI